MINSLLNRSTSEKRSIKHLASVSLIIILWTISSLADAADWEVALKVKSGTAYNQLVIGTDSTATDLYDPVWDTYALMGGTVEAYFPHPEWGLAHQQFHRDIRAHSPGTTIEWPLTVNSSLSGASFIMTWSLLNVPQGNPVILVDEATAQQIDMRSASSYSFTYTGTRSFLVQVTEAITCANLSVRIARAIPEYFSTLQEAYNAANDGETIQSRAVSFTENLNININKSISFSGGYDCTYTSVSGVTIVNGILTIGNGSVTIEDFVVQ